ncbi:hypothetical protein F2Q69_00019250 [Brassica cretica]|uniref:RIN4 pathogenic type III effector avirulence factor Avr cleavage site domain-containing protein n=1 Tax=Brassica cretica TaxID=69181 RepID=A0A8S9Q1W1_BRACR|nr:hypothetical protein F2Q69_00019250 [Brassica cretica]
MTRGSWICSVCQGQKCQEDHKIRAEYDAGQHVVRYLVKLRELSYSLSISGRCPRESPLANGQILIDGQVLIRLMADSMTNRRVQVVNGDAHVSAAREESQGVSCIQWYEAQFIQLAVGSKSVSGGGVSCLSVQRYKVMLKCNLFKNIKVKSKIVPEIWSMSDFKDCVESLFSKVFSWMAELKDFDSRLNAHEWNQKAKEEINLQKDVQVSVQALEHVRNFDSKIERRSMLWYERRSILRIECRSMLCFLSRGRLTTLQYKGHNLCYRMLIDLKPLCTQKVPKYIKITPFLQIVPEPIKMRRRNQVEQVVMTDCNPEDKGYETTVINTCSRSRKSLPQLVEACVEPLRIYNLIPGRVSQWVEDVFIGSAEGVSRPEVSRSVNKYKAHHKEFVRGVLHKNGEMKQSKKLLEDIAGIAGNCLTVCPSQEGKSRLHLWIRTCGVLDIWSHHKGILRQCPQESPLANGQILIYGQVLIRLLAGSMTNRCVQVVDGDAHVSAAREESQGVSWIRSYEAQFIQLVVGSKSVSGGGVSCLSVQQYKVMLKCSLFKNIMVKSKTVPEIWSMSDFKLGLQIKTIDKGDGYSEWQWDFHMPFIRRLKNITKKLQAWLKVKLREVRRDKRRQGDAEDEQACSSIKRCRHKVRVMDLDQTVEAYACLKKIMKEFQAWLKVKLREVRRDKRRQGDTEDEQACSSIKRCQHKVRVMDLDQTCGVLLGGILLGQVLIQKRIDHDRDLQAQAEPLGGGSFHGVSWRDRGLYTHDRESNDLVNHIGGIFRYFILDVVDPGSTPDVARCDRELVVPKFGEWCGSDPVPDDGYAHIFNKARDERRGALNDEFHKVKTFDLRGVKSDGRDKDQ